MRYRPTIESDFSVLVVLHQEGRIETFKYRASELICEACGPDFQTAMIHTSAGGIAIGEPWPPSIGVLSNQETTPEVQERHCLDLRTSFGDRSSPASVGSLGRVLQLDGTDLAKSSRLRFAELALRRLKRKWRKPYGSRSIWQSGRDGWFWPHVVLGVGFTVLPVSFRASTPECILLHNPTQVLNVKLLHSR